MGLESLSYYTHSMMSNMPLEYQCGDLRVCPASGTIIHAGGGAVSLGPVNMQVLAVLLARPGEVVRRGDIYDAVWGSQVIGDGALTRCISDIRAELRNLSGRDNWIETLPKRGYRWTGSVAPISGEDSVAVGARSADSPGRVPPRPQTRWSRLAGRGAGYLIVMVLMASGVVWILDRVAESRPSVIAVLPLSAGDGFGEIASEIDLELVRYLAGLDSVRMVSPSAIEARPSNPFPFFYYEFGARWLVESSLRQTSSELMLTVTVADARTGIVEMQLIRGIMAAGPGDRPLPVVDLDALSRFLSGGEAR